MKKVLAFVLYIFYYRTIKRKINQEDIVLSIYGHDPKGSSIEKVINWLIDKDYEFITPQEVLEFKKGSLDKKRPVWLSFDDGWKSNYYELLPILEKHNIPATIFISTKAINDGYYWFNKVRENRNSNLFLQIDDMWKMSNSDRVSIVDKLPEYSGQRMAMNRDELYNISKSKNIFLANHTDDHVICDRCDIVELQNELKICENKIKEITGKESSMFFAYPNGDYDNQTISVLKDLDYQFAATTNLGVITRETDLYQIPRNVLPDDASLYESILQIYGLWTPFFNKIKKIFNISSSK